LISYGFKATTKSMMLDLIIYGVKSKWA